ncbi:hypothetical protein [Halobaculum litoreum]|uniref:DUF8101 domain-containing protein n=1 Tax=Halobaculum litoreum TaxID=3031998 RepID=A0ABD5XNR6_9EURY|nr:hypothetical protein [Halobaculum sp. DT92]
MDDEPDDRDGSDAPGLPEPAAPDDADLPADVEAALTQLVEAARDAVRDGRTDDALAAVDTARTVASNKLPAGDRRDRLVHGCDRVADLAADDPAVATEYLAALRRRLPP